MAFRNGIVLQLGAIATSVNIESAVIRDSPLKTVCRGPLDGDGDATKHGHLATPIKNNPGCPTCENTVYATFEKAKEVSKGEFAIMEAGEVASTRESAIGATKDIIALSVHRAEDIATQTIQSESVYYLTPHKPALAPLYAMMVDALRRHPEYALMGQWTPVAKVGLYQVKLFGDTLVMEGRHRTESLKIAQQPVIPIGTAEQGMVDLILGGLVADFDPATYADIYQRNLDALVASKTTEEGIVSARTPSARSAVPTGTVDLAAVLAAALAG